MLSSLPGSAITSVLIDGVMHEFQTIDGIMEDVTTIVLNLKNVVVKNNSEEDQVIRLITNKEGVVTAGDIECPSDVEIMNKDQVIATIVKGGSLNMEMTVSNGRGFVRAEANKKLLNDLKGKFFILRNIFRKVFFVSLFCRSSLSEKLILGSI